MATIEVVRYRAVEGSHFSNADAETIGPILRKMAERGQSDAAGIVHEAEKPQSKLHPYFEWDNRVAGETYRLEQARRMAQAIKVVVIHKGKEREVRAFHPIRIKIAKTAAADSASASSPLGMRPYLHITQILGNPDAELQVLQESRRALLGWRKRTREYEDIFSPGLQRVAQAVDDLEEEIDSSDKAALWQVQA